MRLISALRWVIVAALMATLIAPTLIGVFTGTRLVVVDGKSMVPTFQFGDVVLIAPPTRADFTAGRIVTVRRPDGSIYTHRIQSIHDGAAQLKGDGNTAPDPGTVTYRDLAGAVHGHIAGPLATLLSYAQIWPARISLGVLILALILLPLERPGGTREHRQAAITTLPGRHTSTTSDTAAEEAAKSDATDWINDPLAVFDDRSPSPTARRRARTD